MDHRKPACLLVVLAAVLALGCKPAVGQAPSLITDYALLAVFGEPPEAKPGDKVTYSYLLASPTGTFADATAGWDVCLTPKPPAENNAVASACNPPAPGATTGLTFDAPIPTNACQLFGPIAPPVQAGQPAIRPRDPDATGGYYLPVRVKLADLATGDVTGFAFERITCNLANAASAIVKDYNTRYQVNQDPGIASTDLITSSGIRTNLDTAPQTISVSPGDTVDFEATFTDSSAETFPVLDSTGDALADQRESLHMSWFASSGSFVHDRTGVSSTETATSTSNTWKAPTEAMDVYLWLVLRDSRGGTAFKAYQLHVGP
jgi:plastocyanin